MPFIAWSDSYSVGVPAFDKQHQQLITLINKLHEAMAAGHGNDVMGPLLNHLIEYTQFHFSSEEKLMEKYNYPTLAIHKQEHLKLTKQVIDFRTQFETGQSRISVQVMQFLKEWLIHHILETDKHYGPFFARMSAV